MLEVPGLDVPAGLHYVGGRMSTYLVILRMFAEQQGGLGAQVRAALDRGDPEAAMQAMHSAKGILGTIGATTLHGEATVLYQALRACQPRAEVDALLARFDLGHEALVAALLERLPADAGR